MRSLQALFIALIVLFAVCSAAPAYPGEMDDVLVGLRPVYPLNRLAKRWSRMEPSIRFAGGSNAAWFV
ncbi:hypothetical protein PRIPAC_74680 [Pristionchus pacificus]|uniref:Uncharacterized protein n=1 Tax=Pristionchus pacificus TaxID=54126 RepID=A0A2A6BFW0_PRIPA|nr:hypothetical protein PRIPAC_74680 [Pristionchus pacificus]|eukprot:PDM64770.1 hypothetical protein PRIPAC_53026 [Pristionchus pacificus]